VCEREREREREKAREREGEKMKEREREKERPKKGERRRERVEPPATAPEQLGGGKLGEPKSTSNQSSKPCTVLPVPIKKSAPQQLGGEKRRAKESCHMTHM